MPRDLRELIREIPDFPQPGVLFRDITPLLQDSAAFRETLDWLERVAREAEPDAVIGIESRGFIFGAPLADRLGVAFVPVRKPGKLPAQTHAQEYALEYGTNVVEIHRDGLARGQRALIVDDLLATGGTALAAAKLVEYCQAHVAAMAFVVELNALGGRERLHHYEIESLLRY